MKTKKDEIPQETIDKITKYVYENYKNLADKKLFINEASNCYYISDHKDASPLILGKKTFT